MRWHSPGDAAGVADQLRATFASGLTRPLAWRRSQLGQLGSMLRTEDGPLTAAMAEDMGKPPIEGWLTEVAAVRRDIEGILHHLDDWASPRRAKVPWQLRPGRAEIVPEPLGGVLVIGPWNYPVRCVVLPLAFALAAGNTAAVKPSELAPATSEVLAKLLGEYLDTSAVRVVQGGAETAKELLDQQWDHVFFTGGSRVGREVMVAAAQHLTPVTLELGGKNPAVVDGTADIGSAGRRIAWGKFLNAGQTCVAPDYVVVDKGAEDALVASIVRWVRRFYGDDPQASGSFARIVNEAHLARLTELLARTQGRVALGGTSLPTDLYLSPTVLTGVGWDDPVMEEEIFGPVLPVLTFASMDEVLAQVNSRDKPLAIYLYSRDPAATERLISGTSSGGVCVNHNAVQLGVPSLPFGGVGRSGTGAYHGKSGFDTFSHAKAVLRKPVKAELPIVYPPYGRAKRWALRKAV